MGLNRSGFGRVVCLLLVCQVAMSQYNPLSNLNRNNGMSERNFIEIPQMGTDINVTCAGREIVVAISGDYIQRNLQWLDSGNKLSLADYSCKAVQDKSGNRIIRIRDDFTKCGNRITTETTNITGTLEVTSYTITNKLIHDDPHGEIAREIDLLEFDCVYPATQMTSQFMQPWLKSAAHEDIVKDLTGRMQLYKDENYTDPYMEPPTLSLNDDLYIQVELEKPILTNIDQERTSIAVVMEQCWGTPTQDREGEGILGGKYGAVLKYFMIKDGCPVDDPSLKIVSNGKTLTANYQIKMFKFIGEELNDVWLHCTVRACNSTTPENCLPECDSQSRSKRSLRRKKKQKKKKLWYISGPQEIMTELPIQRKLTDEEVANAMDNFYGNEGDKKLLEPGSVPFKIMLIVLAVIVALSAILTIVCIYVKRRNALLNKYGNNGAGVAPVSADVIYANQMPGNQPSSGPSSHSGGTGSDKFIPY